MHVHELAEATILDLSIDSRPDTIMDHLVFDVDDRLLDCTDVMAILGTFASIDHWFCSTSASFCANVLPGCQGGEPALSLPNTAAPF